MKYTNRAALMSYFQYKKPKGTFYLFFTKLLKIIKLTSNSTPC